MADNTTTNPGTGGDTFGSDDITGVKYPRLKLIHGADGVNAGDVSTANGLPVQIDQTTPGTTNAVKATNLPTTVDTNSGSKSASTLRTVIATDQPAISTAGVFSVKTDQTTHGTTDLVAADITKVAGSAISQGHGTAASAVRVELPTDGTGVVGLNAGTAIVGKVGIDQTTPGTTNAVKATNFPTTVDTNSGNKSASTIRTVTASDDALISNISTKLTYGTSDVFPQYNSMTQLLPVSTTPLLTSAGALITNSSVETDLGSVRANFTGSSLLTTLGTCTFTNGSPYVTGSGFTTGSVEVLSMVKLNADGESSYTPVQYIISDTQLQLAYPYVGTSATGAASFAPLATSTGSGATISVASGQCTIASGTTNASQSFVWGVSSTGDLQAQAAFSISQRIANQDIYFGLEDNALSSITKYARFHFSGTTNTQVITETGWNPSTTPSANEIETNTVTLPNGTTTATARVYKIALTQDSIVFSIDGVVVATHTKRIPHIRRTSNIGFVTLDIRVLNGTGASNTNIIIDYITGRIYNRLDTIQSSPGDITNSQVVSQKAATTSSNTLQSAVSATGNGTSLVTDGMSTVVFTVSGTFSATVTFEGTEDGTNWTGLNAVKAGTSVVSSSTTTTGTYTASCTGYQNVRARVTWTSGTSVTVTAHASPLNTTPRVINANNLGTASTALPAAATAGDPTNIISDKYGRQVMLPNTIRDLVGSQTTTITSSTSETTIITAAASVYNDLLSIFISNTSATAARVDIRDATAGSVIFQLYIPAGDMRGISLNTPWPQTTANNNWTAQSSASVSDLRISASFAKNK